MKLFWLKINFLRLFLFENKGPHEPCGPLFAIGPNFDLWISPANRVPNNLNQPQKARFGSLCPLLIESEKFRRVTETSFCKGGGAHMAHVVPPLLLGRISKCEYLLPIECQTIGVNAKQQNLGACRLC